MTYYKNRQNDINHITNKTIVDAMTAYPYNLLKIDLTTLFT